jgi:hypothetical protein
MRGVHGDMRGPGQNPRAKPSREPGRDAEAAGHGETSAERVSFTAVAELGENGFTRSRTAGAFGGSQRT